MKKAKIEKNFFLILFLVFHAMSLVADVEVAGVFHKKKTPKLNYELESISHPIFVKRF